MWGTRGPMKVRLQGIRRLRRILPSAALLLLLPVLSAAAGELRALLEGEVGVRDDGPSRTLGAAQTGQGDLLVQDRSFGRGGLSLQLSYLEQQRFSLAFGYSPFYERLLNTMGQESGRSGIGHRLDLGVRGELSRHWALQAREQLLSIPDVELYAANLVPGPFAASRHGRELQHDLRITLEDEISRRASFVAGATHTLRRFGDAGLYDAETRGVDLGGAFHYRADDAVEATAGFTVFSWQDGRTANVETVNAAWTQTFGRETRLRLEGGAFHLDATGNGRRLAPGGVQIPDRQSGWRGGVQAGQQRRLLQWDAAVRHDISPGYGLGRPAIADSAFLGLSSHVGRNLTVGLDGSASRQRELGGTLTPGVNGAAGDDLTRFAAGTARLDWTFLPTLRLTGSYSRVWQRSRVAGFENLSFNRYFLGLAFRIWSTGEAPRGPQQLGRRGESVDAEPDAH